MKYIHSIYGYFSHFYTVNLINLKIVLFIVITFIPNNLIEYYIGSNFVPDTYWFIAIPTHIFVTLVFIFFLIKAYNYIITDDNQIKEGKFNIHLKIISQKYYLHLKC
jgi:hypothetical protein